MIDRVVLFLPVIIGRRLGIVVRIAGLMIAEEQRLGQWKWKSQSASKALLLVVVFRVSGARQGMNDAAEVVVLIGGSCCGGGVHL